jgi:hypothetical protein
VWLCPNSHWLLARGTNFLWLGPLHRTARNRAACFHRDERQGGERKRGGMRKGREEKWTEWVHCGTQSLWVCSLRSEFCHFCHILLIRRKSQGPACPQEEGMDTGGGVLLEACLRTASAGNREPSVAEQGACETTAEKWVSATVGRLFAFLRIWDLIQESEGNWRDLKKAETWPVTL